MDNQKGGQSSASQQQQTATELARKKVLEAYRQQPQNYRSPTEASPAPQVNAETWKKYHSAWQDYYQKYYGEYYGKAARDYVARERLKMEREQAEKERIMQERSTLDKAPLTLEEYVSDDDSEKVQSDFKAKIQATAKRRASKFRKSKHFIPLTIGATILVLGLLLQYNQVIIANAIAYISPGNSEVNEITEIDPTIMAAVHEQPTLMIPKLNVEVPIKFGAGNSVTEMNKAMDNGVAHYAINGASAKPGEIGNFAVSGHSAGNVYQQSNYKFIFSGLERMKAGDMVYVDYEGVRYTYKIEGTKTVTPQNVRSLVELAQQYQDQPMITLITCTPLGTSKYRLLVYGTQISPSYDDAATAPPDMGEDDGTTQSFPENDPSPLEQFWRWLTGQD